MLVVTARMFLCGGEAGLRAMAKEFVEAAGGRNGRVALLLQGGPRTGIYAPHYFEPWLSLGLRACDLVAPDIDGKLHENVVLSTLEQATAIFVGGGNTSIYQRLYCQGKVAETIRARCIDGIPYGGLSAGMLIAGTICPLDPDETGEAEIRMALGLGLFSGVLCEPHFSSEERLVSLKKYLSLAGIDRGYGVDDDACLMFAPTDLHMTLAGRVTQVHL
jgi:cyanophycinase